MSARGLYGMPELARLTAHELLAAFAGRACSPAELVDVLIDRIETSESVLNAFVTTTFDRARART